MQKITALGLSSTGIVGTLVIIGMILLVFDVSKVLGLLAIFGGVITGIALGALGVLAVAKRVF